MNSFLLRGAAALVGLSLGAGTLACAAAEPDILAQAREGLGGNLVLNAVRSIHYHGTLTRQHDGATETAEVDIIMQKPNRQRITEKSQNHTVITALDGYDGWRRWQNHAEAGQWRQDLMTAQETRSLRAGTWENLHFFKGIEKHGGRVITDEEPQVVDGVACRKVTFVHDADNIFIRYFNLASGKLLLTETDGGATKVVEHGELIAGGIRFPRTVVTTGTGPDGSKLTVTVTFDRIIVNKAFADSVFAVPLFLGP